MGYDHTLISLEPEQVFVYLKNKDYSWHEILQEMENYSNYTSYEIKKSIYSKESLKPLEFLGLDYNFRDRFGNNFLYYVLEAKPSAFDSISFYDTIYDYLYEKITNMYEVGGRGKNILFNFLTCSPHGKEFFDVIKKFPLLDIHQIGKDGKNLLHDALIQGSPEEIKDYLINNNVSLVQIDKDGNNLLNYFPIMGKYKYNEKLFCNLIEVLDITNKNKYNKCCLDDWLEFCTAENVAQNTKKVAANWLLLVCEKILEKKFIYTNESLVQIKSVLKNNKENFFDKCYYLDTDKRKELYSLFETTIGFIGALELDNKLSHKDNGTPKVKI